MKSYKKSFLIRDPTQCKQLNKWTNLILRCSFVSRRLCRESALRAKHDEQNVKVKSWGAMEALWRRTEAEHSAEQQRMEAPPWSKLVYLRSPDLHPSIPICTHIPMLMIQRVVTISRVPASIFFWLKSSKSQDESTTFPGHFLVHWLIAGGLKLQSDCHPMVGNLDRPWGVIHRLVIHFPDHCSRAVIGDIFGHKNLLRS